jgi:Protein of unknown function (DUF4232)
MNHHRATCGRAAAALISLAAVAALAACSSSTSSSTSSSGSPSTPSATSTSTSTSTAPVTSPSPSASPTAAGAPACANGTLQVKLRGEQGYAGGVDLAINFTNTTSAACTLYGYPGVSLVSSSHAQIGLAAKRTTTAPAEVVTLAPGATGHAQLQIADALNFPTSACGPVQAADLRVYPPGQTAAVFLPDHSQGCAQPAQILFISPVQPG